jgi:hypothetical protein
MGSMTLLFLGALGVWTLLHMKTGRADGRLIENLHQYRRIMAYIMPTRNESVVYFDVYVDAEPIERYIAEAQKVFACDMTHCCVAAGFASILENPTMNRFCSGHRLYQRDDFSLTFSMKRKQLDSKSKLATVKLRYEPGDTFRNLCERINKQINIERSGTKTYQDKEFDLLTVLPRPFLRAGIKLLRLLDYYNILPADFIAKDPLYTSMFMANLGSLGMDAGYHHLYEWGNCSHFLMVGKVEERAVVENGQVVAKRQILVRCTYDERIDDGLTAGSGINSLRQTLLDPFGRLGCLAEDGSDARPLDADAP